MTTNGHSQKVGATLLTHDILDLRPLISRNGGSDSDRYHQAREDTGVTDKPPSLTLEFHDEARDLIRRADVLVATAEGCIKKLEWLIDQADAPSGDPSPLSSTEGQAWVATAEGCIRKLEWLIDQADAASGDPSTQASTESQARDPEASGIGRPS